MEESKLRVYMCCYPAREAQLDEVYLFKCYDRIDFAVKAVFGSKTYETRKKLPDELIENGKVHIIKLLSYIKEQSIHMHTFSVSDREHYGYVNIEKFELVQDDEKNNLTSPNKETVSSRFKGDLIKKTTSPKKYCPEYDVDLVFCIDTSENMNDHIDRVKEWIPEWCEKIEEYYSSRNRKIGNYRAKLITFSDYRQMHKDAIMLTDFYDLKADENTFKKALECVNIQRGCVGTVSGLEALTYALHSNWSKHIKRMRYIIVFSNSEINSLDDQTVSAFHPKGMPGNFTEFLKTYTAFGGSCTVFLMVPDKKNWNLICDNIRAGCIYSAAGEGLKEDKWLYEYIFSDIPMGFD